MAKSDLSSNTKINWFNSRYWKWFMSWQLRITWLDKDGLCGQKFNCRSQKWVFFYPPLANMKDFSKPVCLPLHSNDCKEKCCKNNFVLNMIDASTSGPSHLRLFLWCTSRLYDCPFGIWDWPTKLIKSIIVDSESAIYMSISSEEYFLIVSQVEWTVKTALAMEIVNTETSCSQPNWVNARIFFSIITHLQRKWSN